MTENTWDDNQRQALREQVAGMDESTRRELDNALSSVSSGADKILSLPEHEQRKAIANLSDEGIRALKAELFRD